MATVGKENIAMTLLDKVLRQNIGREFAQAGLKDSKYVLDRVLRTDGLSMAAIGQLASTVKRL